MKAITLICAGVVLALVAGPTPLRAEDDLAPKLRAALVKVHVTSQAWDVDSPWNKQNPRRGSQRGVVVRPGLVLTPASMLANQVMIEVSEANSARRYPASLAHIDYGANLALVKIEDEGLALRMKHLDLCDPVTIDDEFEIWQLGDSDLLERATGRVQKVYASGVRLEMTIKTTLGDNGDGQVALRNGRLAGLVLGTRSARQEGTILSVETIEHFLTDFGTGSYRGFGAGGTWTHELLREDLRAYFGVPESVHGVGVSRVIPGHTGDGALKERDVITEIKGHPLDDEGMFAHPKHGRLHHGYLLIGETHPGDSVPAKILRDGKILEVKIPVMGWPYDQQRVPSALYDLRPPYLVAGGLVILELSRQSGHGSAVLAQYQDRSFWDMPDGRKRIVFASRVLADAANKGLDQIASAAILSVNGVRITRIEDVAEALKTPVNGYHVFKFEGVVSDFVIKADDLEAIDKRIAERYRIAELRYLE